MKTEKLTAEPRRKPVDSAVQDAAAFYTTSAAGSKGNGAAQSVHAFEKTAADPYSR